jgi:ribose transport system ATP-binding protein
MPADDEGMSDRSALAPLETGTSRLSHFAGTATAAPARSASTFLSLRGLSKVFAGQWALHEVDLDLRAAEVHALLGKNGSGKSTLIKILAGFHAPESGATATVRGEPFVLGSSRHAHEAGLRFIHQDLGLAGSLDVVDNLALGASYGARYWISDRRERRRAERILAEHGLRVDVSQPVQNLTPAQQSMVAIVRAVHDTPDGSGLLVLDEPTASLPEQEVEHLFELLKNVRAKGITILYVTHRLPEVFQIADRVSVLRDGRRVATEPTSELDQDTLAEVIVGHPVQRRAQRKTPPGRAADRRLTVSGLRGGPVRDISFELHAGEILGMTGLIGSGFEATLALIFGAVRPTSGEIKVGDEALDHSDPRAAIAAGVGYVPSDRKRLSAIQAWTLRENLTLTDIPTWNRTSVLDERADKRDAGRWLAELDIDPPDPERVLSSLSGGNQQRVVLGKWLRRGSRVFLLDEPTIGVDVGAKDRIYALLRQSAATGTAILMASSDLEELEAICTRVLVLRDGVVAADLEGAEITADRLFAECAGLHAHDALASKEPIHNAP